MQPTPWYEPVLNERNLHIAVLKGRIGNIRAAALPVRALSGALAAGLKFDPNQAAEALNALLREIDKEIP